MTVSAPVVLPDFSKFSIGALTYQGTWNASTNTPTLTSSVGTMGQYYVVSVAGTTSLDGHASWSQYDAAIFNGTTWDIVQGGITGGEVTAALGFTPANKAGDTLTGPLNFSGSSNSGLTVASLTTTQKNALTGAAGMVVYDTTLSRFQFWDGAAWHGHVRLEGDTIVGDVLFTDGLYDIGKSGATRPRNGFFSGTLQTGGLIRSGGSIATDDGRYTMSSGPVLDFRTTTSARFYLNDGVTPCPVQVGGTITPVGTTNYLGTAGGSVNVMTATPAVAMTAYTVGAEYIVQANITNTSTTPTINFSGLGAKTIVKRASTALAAGDYVANMMMKLIYDGTNMQLINPVVN